MYPNPQARWSEKTIVMDCLMTAKCLTEHNARDILESSTPVVRNSLQRFFNSHSQMAQELFQIAQSRGWYPKPVMASQQHEQQILSRFQPVGAGQGQPVYRGNQPNYQGYSF